MSEGLQIRVVRTIAAVAPRRLPATDITEAVRQDGGEPIKGDSVYATLSQLSKAGAGPLDKERKNGIFHYGVSPGIDIDAWIASKLNRTPRDSSVAAARTGPDINPGYAAEIIRVLRGFQKRATSSQIEGAGEFLDPKEMRLALALMCKPGGPLERADGDNRGAFEYGIRRDFDTNAWLRALEEGANTETAAAPAVHPRAPGRPEAATAPAAVSAGARTVRGRDTQDDDEPNAAAQKPEAVRPGPGPSPSGTSSAAAAAASEPETAAPPKPETALSSLAPAPDSPSARAAAPVPVVDVPAAKWAKETPAPGAQLLNGEAHALVVDLVIIAAANLAAEVRELLDDGGEADSDNSLTRALRNFERADRIYVSTKAAGGKA